MNRKTVSQIKETTYKILDRLKEINEIYQVAKETNEEIGRLADEIKLWLRWWEDYYVISVCSKIIKILKINKDTLKELRCKEDLEEWNRQEAMMFLQHISYKKGNNIMNNINLEVLKKSQEIITILKDITRTQQQLEDIKQGQPNPEYFQLIENAFYDYKEELRKLINQQEEKTLIDITKELINHYELNEYDPSNKQECISIIQRMY